MAYIPDNVLMEITNKVSFYAGIIVGVGGLLALKGIKDFFCALVEHWNRDNDES